MNKKRAEVRLDSKKKYLDKIKKTNTKKPNIVLVFVDDMGYGDISCFGSKAINTPCLDKLANDGVKLNNFYRNNFV